MPELVYGWKFLQPQVPQLPVVLAFNFFSLLFLGQSLPFHCSHSLILSSVNSLQLPGSTQGPSRSVTASYILKFSFESSLELPYLC